MPVPTQECVSFWNVKSPKFVSKWYRLVSIRIRIHPAYSGVVAATQWGQDIRGDALRIWQGQSLFGSRCLGRSAESSKHKMEKMHWSLSYVWKNAAVQCNWFIQRDRHCQYASSRFDLSMVPLYASCENRMSWSDANASGHRIGTALQQFWRFYIR